MHNLAEKIAREIAEAGPLPFARFMELALYCPECGYYEREKDTVGQRGDFYTSASVGALFGQLLAFQFAAWLDELRFLDPRPATFDLIEAGAHDGRLARDILNWLQAHRPDLFERLCYGIVEPSARRRHWQRETLNDLASHVHWFDSLQAIANESHPTTTRTPPLDPWPSTWGHGVIFSNELLDALPIRRFGWDARQHAWFEWGVTVKEGQFVWTQLTAPSHSHWAGKDDRAEPMPPELRLPDELLDVLPDGYVVEVNDAAQSWWREAARGLRRGRLLAFDYGLTAEELFHPGRKAGTLRAYHRHHMSVNVLADVGEQDLTSHVNFSAIQAVGEMEGLVTEQFTTQAQFLTRIAARVWQKPAAFGEWTSSETRQFQTLTHPDHLGRALRVLIQTRNMPAKSGDVRT